MGRSRQLRDGQLSRETRLPRIAAILALSLIVLAGGCTKSILDVEDDFSTAVVPRLQNGEPERLGPVINEAAFNAGAVGRTMPARVLTAARGRSRRSLRQRQVGAKLALPVDLDAGRMLHRPPLRRR